MSEVGEQAKNGTAKIGRPKKDEYVLQVNIRRAIRGKYVRGTSRSLNLLNAPWEVDEFTSLVERMARKAAGKETPSKATTREVVL